MECECRGVIKIKGKGDMRTYFLKVSDEDICIDFGKPWNWNSANFIARLFCYWGENSVSPLWFSTNIFICSTKNK